MSDKDIIYRQDAIDALDVGAELLRRVLDETDIVGAERAKFEWGLGLIESCIYDMEELPSAEPEIIRCKDCKYRDENWRRVSVKWLPCMDARTGSNWYCGSAERGEQDDDRRV